MLGAFALPSPALEPAAYAAFYLTNPLLVAAYPTLCAERAAQVAAGTFDGPALSRLALALQHAHKHLRTQLPMLPADTEAASDLYELVQTRTPDTDRRVFSQLERGSLRMAIMLARASERPWLHAPIAAEVARRLAVAERVECQAVSA